MSDDYVTFLRSARNFEEFASAQKTIVQRGLSLEEARRQCKEYNSNRSRESEKLGRKMEYTREGALG